MRRARDGAAASGDDPRAGARNAPDVRGAPARYAGNVENEPGSVSVLLVDDEPILRDAVARYLRARGAHVVVAGSAIKALVVLERRSIDVLVSDIQMPERDGFWLIREVRSRPKLRSIPAIAFTALGREHRQQILHAGFSEHVVKANPYTLWVTIQIVRPRLAG